MPRTLPSMGASVVCPWRSVCRAGGTERRAPGPATHWRSGALERIGKWRVTIRPTSQTSFLVCRRIDGRQTQNQQQSPGTFTTIAGESAPYLSRTQKLGRESKENP